MVPPIIPPLLSFTAGFIDSFTFLGLLAYSLRRLPAASCSRPWPSSRTSRAR